MCFDAAAAAADVLGDGYDVCVLYVDAKSFSNPVAFLFVCVHVFMYVGDGK